MTKTSFCTWIYFSVVMCKLKARLKIIPFSSLRKVSQFRALEKERYGKMFPGAKKGKQSVSM